MAAQREPDVHNDIQPVHPDTSGGVCATCHAPEDASLLVLLDGKRAPLDQSYRLCAQCHFRRPKHGLAAGTASGSTAGRDAGSSWPVPIAMIRTTRRSNRGFPSAPRFSKGRSEMTHE